MDILEFAINMELEGSKYYKEQAESYKDSDLYEIFLKLADDEEKHAQIIRDIKDGRALSIKSNESNQAASIFMDKSKKISEITFSPEQLDVYRFALGKEEESIELYKELMQKSENKDIYKMLIEEETWHYKVMSSLVQLMENPKQWTESAEFGVREEY
jgi:rubrerythrin